MKKNFTIYLLIVVLVLALILFWPGFRRKTHNTAAQILSGTTGRLYILGGKVRRTFSFVAKISDLKKQNDDLATKITDLQIDKSQIAELEIENKLLKQELGFLDESNRGALVPAKIVERDPTAFLDHITIDRGRKDGLVQGMAVVSSGVLVGQIGEVFDDTATVVLVTSKDSIIQAMLQDCRAKGIMKGGISGLYLDNITQDTEYKIGGDVVTSGLGGRMKEGILIGKAGKLQSSSSGIFKTISVEPIIDLSKLELVFVQK